MTKPASRVLLAHMLLAAALGSLNDWVAIAETHGDYSPFAVSARGILLTFDETHAYAPPARWFMLTGRIPADADNYERRDSHAGIPFVPAAVLGGMGYMLGSLERAFVTADVLFPPLALGLLYAASNGIIRSSRLRLLLAWSRS